MLNEKKYKKAFIITFLIIQLVLFFIVQLTNGKAWMISAYTVVVLCFLFTFLFFEKSKKYAFTHLALFCTLMADLFLVAIAPVKQLPAMIFFSGTQIFYFLRLYFNSKSKKEKRIHIFIRIIASVLSSMITIIVLKNKTDAVSLISMFYYANLVVNIIFAFVQYKDSRLLAIGLLLFLCCDTLVGLNALMTQYIKSPNAKEIFGAIFGTLNWAWVFYAPSQVLLSLSLAKFQSKKHTRA